MKNSGSSLPIQLGWFTLCLKAAHYEETLGFYQKLGFSVVGGKAEHGYAVLANGSTEITVMKFLQKNLINFRGANIDTLSRELEARGFEVYHQGGTDPTSQEAQKVKGPRRYDPKNWPAEFHTGEDGKSLPVDDAGDFLIDDPDGNSLYFDSVPLERLRYEAGEKFSTKGLSGASAEGKARLGRFVLQLRVKDLGASRAFYERLGLSARKELPELGYVEMGNGMPVPFTIGLNGKSAPSDVLYFECEDLESIAASVKAEGLVFEMPPKAHPDGATMAMLRDPEGNVIFFRQAARA